MHKLFPIVYTDYTLNISNNASKSYNIETGTKVKLDPNEKIGSITVSYTPGNKNDVITSLTVSIGNEDSIELLPHMKNCSTTLDVTIGNITTFAEINSNKSNTYTFTLTTSSGFIVTKSVTVNIHVNKTSYYFFEAKDSSLLDIEQYIPTSNCIKQSSNEYLF
jgi:hypothetical protein